MRPSIKQVAIAAGVSIATVSRLLNNPATVSAETAARIQRCIAQLGFRPNFTGRNLRAGRSRTIGVVLPTLSNTVFAQCLQGIELTARARGYAVMFTTTEYQAADESAAVELLLGHRVDGIILTVADAGASATLDLLERERIAFVLTYNQAPAPAPGALQRASVSVDNRAAACDAVGHLIAAGHRRIRMLSGRFDASDRARQRFLGYLDAMHAAGLAPMDPVELELHTMTAAADYRQLLAHADARPTALFCSNDLLALGAMRELRALGVRLPQEMSVMGFDGVALGALMEPVLASVVQPSEQIGAVAMRTLIGLLEQPAADAAGNSPGRQLLAHSIRSGGSVSAPVSA